MELIKVLAIIGLALYLVLAVGIYYLGYSRILYAAKNPKSLKDALALLCLISFWIGSVLAIEVAIKVALDLGVILIIFFIILLILTPSKDANRNENVDINKTPFIFRGIVRYLLKLEMQIPKNKKCKWGNSSIILTIILLILSLILIILNSPSFGYLYSFVKIWPSLPFTYFLCFCGIMMALGYYLYLLYGVSLIIIGLILKTEKKYP